MTQRRVANGKMKRTAIACTVVITGAAWLMIMSLRHTQQQPANDRESHARLIKLTEDSAPSIKSTDRKEAEATIRERAKAAYGALPLQFEANQGQTDSRVKFISRGGRHTLFLTATKSVLSIRKPAPSVGKGKGSRNRTGFGPQKIRTSSSKQQTVVLRMQLAGANTAAEIDGENELPGKVNYFSGNDPAKWQTNVATFRKVHYHNVYDGIDLIYHGDHSQLEYDFIIAPNADAASIKLSFRGMRGIKIDAEGNLVVDTLGGSIHGAYNQVDEAQFFVRQHYLDFLGRSPDSGGLNYWSGRITRCADDATCIHDTRIGVSAAFFIELEFQKTGYYVYRIYKASLGRQPRFAEFNSDRSKVVGGANLEAGQQAFADEWVQRAEFMTAYPSTFTPEQFVAKLCQTAGLNTDANATQCTQWVSDMNNGKTRVQVLREAIEVNDFKTREYNPAFVMMQYFGYLRRNYDQGGYNFWLGILNSRPANDPSGFNGMVCAFINSVEYQLRFGTVATRNDQKCP